MISNRKGKRHVLEFHAFRQRVTNLQGSHCDLGAVFVVLLFQEDVIGVAELKEGQSYGALRLDRGALHH